MVPRKVRDAQEARSLLEEAARRRVPRAVLARQVGIDPRSLNAWRVNLARREARGRPQGEPALRLVELVSEVQAAHPMVVTCGPFAIEVPADFDEAALTRLLRLVASC